MDTLGDNVIGQGEAAFVKLLCADGSVEEATLLLEGGVDVNARNEKGITLLMYGCSSGRERIVELLIERGADINLPDSNGKTALIYACKNGSERIVELLIAHMVDVDVGDENEKTPLMYACKNGSERIVELLIAQMVDLDIGDENKKTPLMFACEKGVQVVVDMLIRAGINNMNAADQQGTTALTHACIKGVDSSIVDLLIQSGADFRVSDQKKRTALMHACIKGHWDIAKLLLNRGASPHEHDVFGKTALIYACDFGLTRIVKLLIEYGADTNVCDKKKKTVLMYACGHGFERIVTLLSSHGADINRGDRRQKTVFMYACENGNKSIVKLLLAKGINVNASDNIHKTAFLYAIEAEKKNVCTLLVKHGAKINDSYEMKALNDVIKKKTENFSQLLQLGLEALHRYCFDRKPVIDACVMENEFEVKFFLKHGADVNKRDGDGWTALMHACNEGYDRIAALLLENGAGVRDKSEWADLLMIACEKGHERIVELLLERGGKVDSCENIHYSLLCTCCYIGRSDDTAIVNKINCFKMILAALQNLDLTDRQRQDLFINVIEVRETGEFMKALLNDGKILDGAKLKPLRRKVNTSEVTLDAILATISFGVFEWEWCPFEHYKQVSLAALESGLCPGKIKDNNGEYVSPLIASFLDNDTETTETFLRCLYFYPEDYRTLSSNSEVTTKITTNSTNNNLLERVTLQPMSLETWVCLTISKAVSLSGSPSYRKQRIHALKIPELYKKKLMFKMELNLINL